MTTAETEPVEMVVLGTPDISCRVLEEESWGEDGTAQEYPNGDKYVGGLAGGLREGRGTYASASGAIYRGYWHKGMKHGWGAYDYVDKSCYRGDWKDNKRHGYGKYTYANNDAYDGEWESDKKHGTGKYLHADTLTVYEGEWKEGKLDGTGTWTYPEGSIFSGTFSDNLPTGDAVFKFKNGKADLPCRFVENPSDSAKFLEINSSNNNYYYYYNHIPLGPVASPFAPQRPPDGFQANGESPVLSILRGIPVGIVIDIVGAAGRLGVIGSVSCLIRVGSFARLCDVPGTQHTRAKPTSIPSTSFKAVSALTQQ
ncbi:radial spoke head 1 protein [Pelomyxa schiedti]|nr:radial spoke head 1 protein [Pelomyxa schiedti]